MLRRTQSVALKRDLPEADDVEAELERAAPPRPAERRPAERRQADRREGDRRQAERRGMEALRAEALQAVISKVEDRNFGGLRGSISWRPKLGLPASRLILLAVALIAGGLAAFLATHHDEAPPPAPAAVAAPASAAPVEAPTVRVLAATAPIAAGQRVTAEALAWIAWPEANLQDDFITETTAPTAATDLVGTAARADILKGEPIRKARLAAADGSFLAAILDTGMRGVSVSVNAESASGGFIAPNDRVDVVLTASNDKRQTVETILSDVQVIAINGRLGRVTGEAPAPSAEGGEAPQSTETFANSAIATLALDAQQAELVIAATALGKLSLVLRPAGAGPIDRDLAAARAANAAIRLTSPFWTGKTTGP